MKSKQYFFLKVIVENILLHNVKPLLNSFLDMLTIYYNIYNLLSF